MFGYIMPDILDLKVREYQRFRALYCGLCHELGREYGLAGRMILNYDFVFLAALLWGEEGECGYCMRRCAVHPFRRRCVCASARALTDAAGHSVILAYWKAKDGVSDSRGVKRLSARAARSALDRAYNKAAAAYPDFDGQVREHLAGLSALENGGCESIDETADKFARLLASASAAADESARRPLEQLLYHVGRIIYIADGYYDLAEDFKKGEYNPIAARFHLTTGRADEETKQYVLATLMSSARLAASAFELMPKNYWTAITENIIYLGIPDMIRRILDGTYKVSTRGLPKGPEAVSGGTESEK